MKFIIISIVGLLTVLSAFPAAFATHSTPFNGNGSGTFTDTSPTTVLITGTGYYDHLGLTKLLFPSTITGKQHAVDSQPPNRTPTREQTGTVSSRQFMTQSALLPLRTPSL